MSTLTVEQLKTILPTAKTLIEVFFDPFCAAMDEFEINTPLRMSAFIAQIAVESGCFRYTEEIASGEAYEGREDLGNTEEGDGRRFKGRGLIQLTGRANYQKCHEVLSIDCLKNPEILESPKNACRVAGWYWADRKLNRLADIGNFKEITRRVNGGYNGLQLRNDFYLSSKRILGVV